MGLFFNYSKPGPGVSKDAPKKKGLFLFFELLARKIWKLIQANILYFLVSIPLFMIFYIFLPQPDSLIAELAGGVSDTSQDYLAIYQNMFRLMGAVLGLVFVGSGPASAGLAYIMRCFTREQHAWIISDFRDKYKENFKQAIIVGIVDIAVIFLGIFAISFYWSYYLQTHSNIWFFFCVLMCLFAVIYVFMHFYIYQLMVTFESTMKQLYRNAFILALATLPMNVLLAIVIFILTYLFYTVMTPMIGLLAALLLWVGVMRFPIEFYASRTIQRRLLDNMEKKPEPTDTEEVIFNDRHDEQA